MATIRRVPPRHESNTTRRAVVLGGSGLLLSGVLPSFALSGYEDDGNAAAALRNIANGRTITPARVKLVLPELAENGNVVSLLVEVESPMTAADHVKTVHIVAGQNPLANVVRFHLGPYSGRARVQTNVRLATTQTVTAVAEMNDGSLWSGATPVLVTLSACLDGG